MNHWLAFLAGFLAGPLAVGSAISFIAYLHDRRNHHRWRAEVRDLPLRKATVLIHDPAEGPVEVPKEWVSVPKSSK